MVNWSDDSTQIHYYKIDLMKSLPLLGTSSVVISSGTVTTMVVVSSVSKADSAINKSDLIKTAMTPIVTQVNPRPIKTLALSGIQRISKDFS